MNPPSVYDHIRPTASGYPDGVYRVVGADEETVTLLRVGDADGRRVTTGDVVTVRRDALDGFEPAGNPDGNRPLRETVAGSLRTVYWSVRVFVRELVGHPLPAVAALALVAAGAVGEQFVSLPDVAFGAAVLVGSLALAYVGSGRLSASTD